MKTMAVTLIARVEMLVMRGMLVIMLMIIVS